MPITCFGHGWPSGPVAMEDIGKIMRASVISLNFSNAKIGRQIKARVFEVPGSGGFLLTEYATGLENFYRIGKEVGVFNTPEELAGRIRHYLSHPHERDAVARAGYKRTLKEHTYDVRLKEVIDFALAAKSATCGMAARRCSVSLHHLGQKHRLHFGLTFLRKILVIPAVWVLGSGRGPRAARRLVFEVSWRICGMRTFTASGWPGRMFPEQ